MTKKAKDGTPDGIGSKHLPSATGDDESVEGHAQQMKRDGAPEGIGSKHLPSATGDDDDSVEGHRK
jgi:hypothetical protein